MNQQTRNAMKKITPILLFICIGIIMSGCTRQQTDVGESVPEQIKQIFEARNSYIGNNSADSSLLNLLKEYYAVDQKYTMELLTFEEPYVLILHFGEEPDELKMWNISAVSLALIDNCSEVRWDYERDGELITYYVTEDDTNKILQINNIKDYSKSKEELLKLVCLLESKPVM